MLSATWLSGARSGWITAHFDPGFAALAGHYGLEADRTQPLAAWTAESTGELSGSLTSELPGGSAGEAAQNL